MTKLSVSLYNADSRHSLMEDGFASPSFHAENSGKSQSSRRWDQISKISFLLVQVALVLTVLYQLKYGPFQTVAMTDSMDEQPWSVKPWSEKHNVSDLDLSLPAVAEALSTHTGSNIQESVKECNRDDHPCWHLWRLFSSNDISDDSGEALYPSDDGDGVQRHHHHGNYDTVVDDFSDDIGAVVESPAVLDEGGWNEALRGVRWSSSNENAGRVDSEHEESSVLGWFWFSKPLPLVGDNVYPSDDSNSVQRHHHHHGNYNTVTDDDFTDDFGSVESPAV
jgi:hypothetical protein